MTRQSPAPTVTATHVCVMIEWHICSQSFLGRCCSYSHACSFVDAARREMAACLSHKPALIGTNIATDSAGFARESDTIGEFVDAWSRPQQYIELAKIIFTIIGVFFALLIVLSSLGSDV